MNTNEPNQSKDPSKSSHDKKPAGQNKIHQGENFKKENDIFAFAKKNKEQTIAYILLALGLLFLLFFNNLLGGLLIGMVAGYYFSCEIIHYIRNIGQIIGGQDKLRYVILTALLLGLFIAAPGIFIGAFIVAAFKNVLMDTNNTRKPNG